jgi:hypothetical protein
MAKQRIKLSLCEFQDGTFELYIIDPATGEEVQIDGNRRFTDEQRAMFDRLMPACVFTTYEREAM